MKTAAIQTLEEFKHFASYHFKILQPAESIYHGYIREIKVSGYSDMMGLGVSLIKMCLHVVHTDELDNKEFDIGSVLELALELFPRAELEVLDEIANLLRADTENIKENSKEKSN